MPHKNRKLIFLLFTSVFCTLIIPGVSGSGSSKNSKSMVLQANANETQEISILVGKPQPNGRLGPMADGDNPEDGEGEGTGENVEPTGYDRCQQDKKCCYQFTWQGYVEDIPTDPANATCDQLRIDNQAKDMACFDPIIYTIADGNHAWQGRGPNVTRLEQDARENNWNIYCSLTNDKTCLTLKYFSRGKGKQIVNETRFCGSITETISGSRLSSGCWQQNVQGYVREVCSCTTSICNLAPGKSLPSLFIILLGLVGVVLLSGAKTDLTLKP